MKPLRRILWACGLGLLMSTAWSTAWAQSYPAKPIRIVVPYPAGGVADAVSRALAEHLSRRMSQAVVVDNRPGGKQIIATDHVAKSAPDGYTLLLSGVTNLSLNTAAEVAQPFDAEKDLAPVSRLFSAPLMLVVNASLPIKTVGELIQYAKKNPAKLSYASIGAGSSTHLAAEVLKLQAGLFMVHVPYRGSAPAVSDLLGGQVALMFDGGTSSVPHVNSGKLKLLAVSSAKRFPSLPQVPTMAESGLPGFDVTPWWGISAPAGTPSAVVERLAQEIKDFVDTKELRDRFEKQGITMESSSPDEYARHVRSETVRWRNFLKKSGIKLSD